MFEFASVNYLAVLVATLVVYFLGALWYSPVLFGNMWLKIVGLKKEDVTNPTLPMIFGFIANFIQALGLALIFIPLGIITPCWGMTAGLFIGIVFLVSNMLSEYLFHNLSMKHLSITGGYRLVSFLIMGAIIGLWQ